MELRIVAMHLVLLGLKPCRTLRPGVCGYSGGWGAEGGQPAQSRQAGSAGCSSITFMVPLCHQKPLSNKGPGPPLLEGPSSCFANEIA